MEVASRSIAPAFFPIQPVIQQYLPGRNVSATNITFIAAINVFKTLVPLSAKRNVRYFQYPMAHKCVRQSIVRACMVSVIATQRRILASVMKLRLRIFILFGMAASVCRLTKPRPRVSATRPRSHVRLPLLALALTLMEIALRGIQTRAVVMVVELIAAARQIPIQVWAMELARQATIAICPVVLAHVFRPALRVRFGTVTHACLQRLAGPIPVDLIAVALLVAPTQVAPETAPTEGCAPVAMASRLVLLPCRACAVCSVKV